MQGVGSYAGSCGAKPPFLSDEEWSWYQKPARRVSSFREDSFSSYSYRKQVIGEVLATSSPVVSESGGVVKEKAEVEEKNRAFEGISSGVGLVVSGSGMTDVRQESVPVPEVGETTPVVVVRGLGSDANELKSASEGFSPLLGKEGWWTYKVEVPAGKAIFLDKGQRISSDCGFWVGSRDSSAVVLVLKGGIFRVQLWGDFDIDKLSVELNGVDWSTGFQKAHEPAPDLRLYAFSSSCATRSWRKAWYESRQVRGREMLQECDVEILVAPSAEKVSQRVHWNGHSEVTDPLDYSAPVSKDRFTKFLDEPGQLLIPVQGVRLYERFRSDGDLVLKLAGVVEVVLPSATVGVFCGVGVTEELLGRGDEASVRIRAVGDDYSYDCSVDSDW